MSETPTVTNRKFAEINQEFRKACEIVKLAPSARQAAKWRRGLGQAWKQGRKLG